MVKIREHPGRVWLRVADPKYQALWDYAAAYYRVRPTQQARGYHNIKHANNVASRLWQLTSNPSPALILAARWHDAVYVAGGQHNETASAEALRAASHCAGFDTNKIVIERACELIQATTIAHHMSRRRVVDHELAVLLDCDLGSLASPRYQRFVTTQLRITQEHKPNATVLDLGGGAAFLGQLIARRPWLYHTNEARRLWEARAQHNIARFVAEQGTS